MKKKKYCITIAFKILIAEFIFSFIGLVIGYTWQINMENKKWNQLIYSDIKIDGYNLGGKNKQQAKNLIQSKCINEVMNKKLQVTVNDKVYSINKSHFVKNYEINNAIEKAFNFGKDLSLIGKHELIKNGCGKNLKLGFVIDDNLVNDFTKSIEKEVNREPLNASIKLESEGTVKVSSDIKGHKLKIEELNKRIKNSIIAGAQGEIHIKAQVEECDAVITEQKFSLVNAKVSSFSTSFETSSFNRSNNIDICVKAMNGILLMPGEVFSFNQCVGERTKERGYLEAPIIVGNKVESGIGGGICQVSSTLYNAILRMGIKPIERMHHSLPSSYVGIGLDATIDWGSMDLKFKNTFDYPIYIQGYTQDKELYINIFSNSDLNKKKYVIENNIQQTTQTVYKSNLTQDEINNYKKLNGYKVKVVRKTYNDEGLINSEVISDDFYPPTETIVANGARQ